MLGCPFSQEARWTTEGFTRMCVVSMVTGLVKNGFSVFKNIQSLDFFFIICSVKIGIKSFLSTLLQ